VGARLAAAARRLIYGDTSVAFTGPVLTSCDVSGSGAIQLTFDAAHLAGDAVAVRRSALSAPLPLAALATAPGALDAILAAARGSYGGAADILYSSPLEVQYGGTNLTDGVWLPAPLRAQCANGGFTNRPGGNVTGNAACGVNATTGTPLPGFNTASASLPLGKLQAANVTAVRYAFRDNPCCPGIDRGVAPCPPASCPLQGYNSTLPAVPFVAKIENGSCTWMSITP